MKSILASMICILAISCSPKLTPDHSWGNRKWVLMELSGFPVQVSGTDKDASLVFNAAEKRFYGSGGCNRINGIYTISNKGALTLGNAASTMMNCVDQAFEDKFIAALKTVNGYAVEDNVLLLKSGKTVVMRFR